MSNSEADPKAAGGIRGSGWVWTILAIAVASLAYRLLNHHQLEQSSALFIGLPTILAVMIASGPKASSNMGRIMKGITLALLLSGILLVEGALCILISAPLFYLIGFLLGLVIGERPDDDASPRRLRFRCSVLVVLAFMSVEGVHERLSFRRGETVEIIESLRMTEERLVTRLAEPFPLATPLPGALRFGFPHPLRSEGEGLDVGDQRRLLMAGGEGKPGWFELEVTERTPSSVTFSAVKDDSHVAHWLIWQDITMSWESQRDGWVNVHCRVRYQRELDPAWYFGPAQRLAVREMARYLLKALSDG